VRGPFFWAFVSMRGVVGGNAIQGSPVLMAPLWGLGWAVACGSVIGVALTPVWIAAFQLHALIEEEALLAAHGPACRDYMARVPARLVAGLRV